MRLLQSSFSTPLLLAVMLTLVSTVNAFAIVQPDLLSAQKTSVGSIRDSVVHVLWMSTPPKRTARRDMQKRRRRNKNGGETGASTTATNNNNKNSKAVAFEIRPLIKSEAKEQGVDYWIDDQELEKYNARKQSLRERDPGQVPDEKLWKEVFAPYKQNWIGWISVMIVMITTIVVKFPELLQSPVISLPDL
mmetsp:Transcript_19204/g.24718  ORF Transcript_19204/g.24718 Transcript_19204/m.24718 type:complete len:191 (+) Transcript_19204:135-707(+)|eukprot:CAMPEP_0198144334 /NCGR_PEP_ID=MMETSP1443-20131203/14666_1 /TAXON_ID=186043 /ORGANISM="Entomoneis sp., Strain CCMP2396" /LENGTH=190 /DNA_ID=CAMNT_0043807705 /DNA_START=84 /DNA_END=659 /DNA_ORIENTATION=+